MATGPSQRGTYFLEHRSDGLYIWIRHQAPYDTRRKKYGRRLAPYARDLGWSVARQLSHARLMEVVAKIRAEIDSRVLGQPVRVDGAPLLNLIDEYEEHLTARAKNRRYVHEQRRRLLTCIGAWPRTSGVEPRQHTPLSWRSPAQLDRHELAAYLEDRRGRGASATECNHDLRAWSAFAMWLVKTEQIPATPFVRLEMFHQERRAPKVLTEEQVNALVRACRSGPPWLELGVLMLSNTGMRPVELHRLQWENVDLAGGQMVVRRKGGNDWAIPLTPALSARLSQVPVGQRTGPVLPDFPYDEARPNPGGYWRTVRRYTEAAGLHGVTLYWLRHTVATHLIRAGVPGPKVQKIMGHRAYRTTENYVSLEAADVRKDIAVLPWSRKRQRHRPRSVR